MLYFLSEKIFQPYLLMPYGILHIFFCNLLSKIVMKCISVRDWNCQDEKEWFFKALFSWVHVCSVELMQSSEWVKLSWQSRRHLIEFICSQMDGEIDEETRGWTQFTFCNNYFLPWRIRFCMNPIGFRSHGCICI